MDKDEVKSACTAVIDGARHLQPGFGIITDLRGFIPTSEDGRLIIQDTMKTLIELGVKNVVRIVPKDNAGVTRYQWQRSSRAAGYEATYANSPVEAESMMDLLEQENK